MTICSVFGLFGSTFRNAFINPKMSPLLIWSSIVSFDTTLSAIWFAVSGFRSPARTATSARWRMKFC